MTEFHLDTSGFVDGPCRTSAGRKFWSDLDPFMQGYIEAALSQLRGALIEQSELASMHGDQTPAGDIHGYAEDKIWSRKFADQAAAVAYTNLAPETLARIIEDCERFLIAYPQAVETDADRTRLAGGYFWTNRQGGDYRAFPPLTVTLGDDGKVRFA